jgi:hypothetical protein
MNYIEKLKREMDDAWLSAAQQRDLTPEQRLGGTIAMLYGRIEQVEQQRRTAVDELQRLLDGYHVEPGELSRVINAIVHAGGGGAR